MRRPDPGPPLIDLKRYGFKHQHGDITVFGTWAGDNRRPCLVLVPSYRMISADRITPCVVPLVNAWKWDRRKGLPEDCALTSAAFAEALGLTPNIMTCIRITTIIHDHLDDLLKMPPEKPENQAVVAEFIRTDTDGRQHHAEILENV